MRPAREILDALGEPAHRPAQAPGPKEHERVFGVGHVLHAKAAADIRRDDVEPIERNAQDALGEFAPDVMHGGPAHLEQVAAGGGLVAPHRRARFQRHGGDAVVHDVECDDVGGTRERRLRGGLVAPAIAEGDVARRFVPDRGRVIFARAPQVGHGWQHVVFDGDQVERLDGQSAAFRHDTGDCVSHMPHPVAAERETLGHDKACGGVERRRTGQGADAVRIQIGGSEYG